VSSGQRVAARRNGNAPEGTTAPSNWRAEGWQKQALELYDLIGPLRYAAHFYSRMLRRLRIYPARLDGDGKPEAITTGPPVELLNRIHDPSGGRSQMLGSFGRLMFITGEGYLFGRGIGGHQKWTFVWKDELRFDERGNVTHMLGPTAAQKDYRAISDSDWDELPEGSAVAYRFWTPHPRFSHWPDSPMRAVIEDAQELLTLSRTVRATATSRLVKAPVLLMPQEISPGPSQPVGDEDPLNDPLLADFTAMITRALENPADAASMSPLILWAAYDYIDKIKPIWLHNAESDYLERDLRKEAVERLAVSLDFPPEVLKGLGESNHWSAWQISEDMWASHGAPVGQQFCDDLAESYLRPALEQEGYTDWEDVIIAQDPSGVVVKPDRFKDAVEAWKVGAVGYTALRESGGFTEAEGQSDDDHESWVLWLRKGQGEADPDDQGNGPESDAGPPPGQPGPVSEKTNLPDDASLRILGAAELALLRCREQAGLRLRRRRATCPDCLERMQDVPHNQLLAALGPEGVEPFDVNPVELVANGADVLRHLLVNWGHPEAEAARLASAVELFAARTLFSDRPPQIPAGLIARVA
jgi:hypothetical protein